MIDNNSADRNRFINGILIAIAVSLLVASIYFVYFAWRTGLAQSRAETASRLMAIRTSPRSTETPGINAWVSWALLNSGGRKTEEQKKKLQGLVMPQSGHPFPVEFLDLLRVLRTPVPEQSGLTKHVVSEGPVRDDVPALEFRNVIEVENGGQRFVLTARRNEGAQAALLDFSDRASSHLIQINQAWRKKPVLPVLDDLPKINTARVARFYVLSEDESLISLPLGEVLDGGAKTDPNSLFTSEKDEFQKNPLSPSFVSNNFFFNFQFEKPLADQAVFSGLYLDLGGLGLVASVLTPVVYGETRAVLGADVALDLDWEEFAKLQSPDLITHVAHIDPDSTRRWNPWNAFSNGIPADKSRLKRELGRLAETELLSAEPVARKSVYLASTGAGGEVMAIQVDRSTWLLLMVAAGEIALPWTTMALTSLVFLSLVLRIEQNRRQAVSAQQTARSEMNEKQNLLETMQVPLMVVDPNTDELVFCNRAAEAIGMNRGNLFGRDIVAPDPEAQEYYLQTQRLGEARRRAYGIPIRALRNRTPSPETLQQTEHDYAIVRSVAVTAPIESLRADERHRLGILFLVDEQSDLDLLLKQRLDQTQQDEKRRLASLMNHGIDSMARILSKRIAKGGPQSADRDFDCWLSGYLSQRIQLMAWVLENWGGQPVSKDRRMIDRVTTVRTIENFRHVFEVVAGDRQLREQLHWNNGVVSQPVGVSNRPILETQLYWPDESCFSVPRDGVFGFFLSEVLINAVRHGRPGSTICLKIEDDRVRNELQFRVENERQAVDVEQNRLGSKPFGGTVIAAELARLCGWDAPMWESDGDRFCVSWSIATIRNTHSGRGD